METARCMRCLVHMSQMKDEKWAQSNTKATGAVEMITVMRVVGQLMETDQVKQIAQSIHWTRGFVMLPLGGPGGEGSVLLDIHASSCSIINRDVHIIINVLYGHTLQTRDQIKV